MKRTNLFVTILFCLFISLKIPAQSIIIGTDTIATDTTDSDEISEADTIYEGDDTRSIKGGCPDCYWASNCNKPESKHLSDKFVKFNAGNHYSTGFLHFNHWSGIRKFKSGPPFRVLRFNARFHESCIYTGLSSQSSWNKLTKIYSEQCEGKNYYLTLGWRYNPAINDPNQPTINEGIELGLYAHIDHRDVAEWPLDIENWFLCDDDQKGIESVSLKIYIPKTELETLEYAASRPIEMVFYNKGFFVRAENRGVAIRRDFSKETCPLCDDPGKTKMKKVGYFGGTQPAPHTMGVVVNNIYADYEPTWWTHTSYKGFSRSEWYDGDEQIYFASEKIELNLPLSYAPSANLLQGKSFIKFHAGCDITFVTPVLEPPYTIDPLTGLINDFYGEGIDVEVGAEVKHYPTCPPGMNCANTGEVFTYTCPDDKGLKLPGGTDTTDYLTEEMLKKGDKFSETFAIHPNPNNGNMQVAYEIPENETGTLEIYDMVGKKLLTYTLYGGKNTFNISATSLDEGIYFYRATAGGRQIGADKIVVIK